MIKGVISLMALLMQLYSFAQSTKIAEVMKRYYEYGQFNGTVLVADKGKIIYQQSFGWADVEWKVPLTNDTRYEVASVTKTFTAILIMQLVEQGKLRLDSTVSVYLPEYPAETGRKITIRQLLNHSSGIQRDIGDFPTSGNDFPDVVAKVNEEFFNLRELTALVAKRPLLFEPGTQFSYSSDANIVLGRIIEVVTGKSYETALNEMIFQPLKLDHSGYKDHYTLIDKKAVGYAENYLGLTKGRQLGISPAGGMYSTAANLLTWDQALYTEKLVNNTSKQLLFTKTPYVVGNGWKVNLNFFGTKSADSIKTLVSSGALPGFNTLITRFPGENKTIILLENIRRINYKQDEITRTLASILYGKPYVMPRRSMAKELTRILLDKGPTEAKAFFNSQKNNPSWQLNENEINSAGYSLLYNSDTPANAIILFEINTTTFPNSWNAFDSAGEAYMVTGNKEKAIAAYKKSLELNPGNDNAEKMIKSMR